MGAAADYDFRLEQFAADVDTATQYTSWTYDALGRKVAEEVQTGNGTVETLHFYDGWRP